MRNVSILIIILAGSGIPYLTLVLWHRTPLPPPELLYLLIICFVSLTASLIVIVLFLMNKEVRECAVRYLRKLF